jgi:DoxX-like family
MSDFTVVASLFLTVVLAVATAPNLLGSASTSKNAEHLGVSTGFYVSLVSSCEGLVVLGIVIGLYWWPVEIVAASAVAVLMIAAVAAHRRAGEPIRTAIPAAFGLVLAAVVVAGQVWG